MHSYYDDDTIVAISTPVGEGGIGIVRLSGPKALSIADAIFVSKDGGKLSKFKTHTVHYGHIVGKGKLKTKSKAVDEVLLTVMRAPRTYTKEDIVEINCHGGIQATGNVMSLTMKEGARLAEPGEFTKRAFLNGRLDLSQAEAVLDVIRAKTEGSLRMAMEQLSGGLSNRVKEITGLLIDAAADIEASIDFPDEGIGAGESKRLKKTVNFALNKLGILTKSYNDGIIMKDGVLAVICGKPNVGKSSLMNLLLRRDRVIVSDIPGTTRDAVEEVINLKGIPIRIVDTAGVAKAKDRLEKESIGKTRKYIEMADIAILVLDGSSGIDAKDLAIIDLLKDKKKIVVVNKTDIADRIGGGRLKKMFPGSRATKISVLENTNIAALEKNIADTVLRGGYGSLSGAAVSSLRHKEILDKSRGCVISVMRGLSKKAHPELLAIDLKEAISHLGLLTGQTVSEDMLDRIFEKFCIGK